MKLQEWPFLTVIALGFLAMAASPVRALPPDQEIQYTIYEDPEDPESDIVFSVALVLEAVDSSPTTIAWDVTKVVLVEPDSGSGETVWVDLTPDVDTTDGLWWIKHADLEDPQISEFDLAPLMEGTGLEQGSGNPTQIDYAFEAVQYDPPSPPEEPPFEDTAALDGVFWVVGQQEPDIDISAEPVAVIDPVGGGDPPSG